VLVRIEVGVVLVCDVRVAAASAWFDWRFPVIGLHPGGGNRRMLQELVAASVRAGRQFASVR
jgi:enoyl-CoA hydratase